MKIARIVVLAIALGAGGVAAYLVRGVGAPTPEPQPAVQLPTTEILVAKVDIGLGQSVKADDVLWQTWPAESASASFIRRDTGGDGMQAVIGSIARSPFIAGEPIREQKLVKANGSGFMAAILPTGMRAISTEITPETGAGGFILPNDRVDVILSKRDKNPERSGGEAIQTEVVLSNVRVLAIDQAVDDPNGQKTMIGKTATLELNPSQAETLVLGKQLGTLSLALRSIVDTAPGSGDGDDKASRGSTINIVRFGVTTKATPK